MEYHFTVEELQHLGTVAFRIGETAHMLRYHATTEVRLREEGMIGLTSSTPHGQSIELSVIDDLIKLKGYLEEYNDDYGNIRRIDSKV